MAAVAEMRSRIRIAELGQREFRSSLNQAHALGPRVGWRDMSLRHMGARVSTSVRVSGLLSHRTRTDTRGHGAQRQRLWSPTWPSRPGSRLLGDSDKQSASQSTVVTRERCVIGVVFLAKYGGLPRVGTFLQQGTICRTLMREFRIDRRSAILGQQRGLGSNEIVAIVGEDARFELTLWLSRAPRTGVCRAKCRERSCGC